jgi:protein-L-isoaspartate(D-aspartate) O-methyltransferase
MLFRKLLKTHIKAGYLRDHRIQKILGEIPLELLFDESQLQRFVLMDSPVLFYFKDEDNVRTCSAPHMISMMTSMLHLTPEDNVLMLGSKGGLMEAVIAKAAHRVFMLEEHDEVAAITEEAFIKLDLQNIWVRRQNPLLGLAEEAPFDKILIMGALPFIPHQLIEQLADHGVLVVPFMLDHPDKQVILQIIKEANRLRIVNYGGVIFQPLYFQLTPAPDPRDITLTDLTEGLPSEGLREEPSMPDLNTIKSFFDEFTRMPKLELSNIVFNQNESMNLTLSGQPGEKISVDLRLILYNQEDHPSIFKIKWAVVDQEPGGETDWLTIPGNESSPLHIACSVRLAECECFFDVIGIDRNHYHIFHAGAKLIITPGTDPNMWDLLIDFQGEIE